MADLVTYEQAGRVARIRMDDGKVNVMSPAMLLALHAAFDRADREGAVAVLRGRPDVFSAGFDLKTLRERGAADFFSMMRLGAELALKVLSSPIPVLTVVEGHAYPMGAFLALASDLRIGVEGDWRMGMNEVQIGIVVPRFALELARQRLTPACFSRATVTGEMFTPQAAEAAGFLDRVVAPTDLAEAIDLALGSLLSAHPASFTQTKQRARAAAAAAMRAAIDEDITLADAEAVARRRAA